MLIASLSALVVAYLALLLLLYLLQERLLFLPEVAGRTLVATPADVGLAYEELRLQTDDGETLHGWFVPAGGRARDMAVLVFHGNAGNISHRLDTLRIWHRLGLDVLLFDYRGYGRSSGSPSERGTYADGRAAWRYLTGQRGVSGRRIVLFGRSLGGAVAARIAHEVDAAALILESTFTSLPELAGDLYWWLPARRLVRIRYDTRALLGELSCPVLIIHSRDDEIMPFRHAQALFAAAREPKRLLEIAGDHNSGFLRSEKSYREDLQAFLDAL